MAADQGDVEAIKELLSNNPSEEFLHLVADAVKEEFEEAFPELGLNSKAVDDALEDFREKKLDEVGSERQYATKLDYIQTYFTTEVSADQTDELTDDDIENYDEWRKYESLDREKPLSDGTLQDDMFLFREFVKYMTKRNLVPMRFPLLVEIPKLGRKDGVSTKKLDSELATAALNYLRKYKRSDLEHIVLELFCHAGMRKSGLVAPDVEDYREEDGKMVLDLRHREGETHLKKDSDSNRYVELYGEIPEYLSDYIEDIRISCVDEHGREPLLTTKNGRISGSMLKKICYMWTRPCKVGLGCPHDRDPDTCGAANDNNRAFECPSSRAPHHIRTGLITDMRNSGASPKAVNQRCDVSPEVQKRHYDLPTPEEDQARYDDEFERIFDDSDSGYV